MSSSYNVFYYTVFTVNPEEPKGELLILLDGLDEVPTANVNNVIETIHNFVDKYDNNRFILSCRTAARTRFRRFTDIEIVEFDDDQIQSFIEHWFSSELDRKNETAKNCWELLQKEDYKSAKELAHTPLLLTFLCLVYDESQSFPTNRSRLYQDALRILLEKWSAEKRLENRSLVYENLSIEQEEFLLSEVAYHNFVADKLFLEKKEVVKQIKDHLKQNLNAPQYLDGEKVLKTIEIEQGILVERARDVYSFSHLTLQEYLTAQYIYDNNLIEEAVKNHVMETRWKEVFLLIAGLMRGKADKLLLAMEKEANNYLKTPIGQRLVPILQWADEMTKDSLNSPIKSLGRRAIAIAIAYAYANTNVMDNAIAIANAIANAFTNAYAFGTPSFANPFTRISIRVDYSMVVQPIANANKREKLVKLANLFAEDLIFSRVNIPQLIADLKPVIPNNKTNKNELQKFVHKLYKTKSVIPNKKANQKERQEFIDQLFKIWVTAFALTPELLNLSEEEIKEIDNHYFYINRLILDCKEVAVNISPTVWQEIEDRMLRVP